MFIFKQISLKGLFIATACSAVYSISAQTSISRSQLAGQQNVITTAVPFLTISPDSRRASMGDAGVASSPDANSVFWNAASLAFADKDYGIATSYAPWLRSLVPGISYNYLAGYGRINKRSIIGGSFRFFSFGEINFTDDVGNPLGKFNPSEYAIDVCYALQMSKHWAVGVDLKYINSNLAGTRPLNGITPKVGRSGAGDLSALYKGVAKIKVADKTSNKKVKKNLDYTVGINLQNLGSKITYSDKANGEYLPANFKIGTAWTYQIDEFNAITGMLDINKLMVPTPGIHILQSYNGIDDSTDIDGNIIYERTRSEDPVITAALKSFYDSPGGLKEELKEYNISLGFEYIYAKQFMLRGGYFHEPSTKGNRKYLTAGFGIRYKVFGLDAAYLVPFQQRHPLQNQLRFTLIFDLGAVTEADK
ncbi:MAG: type IX secretion system outer membrane channel protein PorV [Bacteroidia bacterium]|nr:type IX secretion system outer membrane channel protein PorV [Bacteroidia bacterium]